MKRIKIMLTAIGILAIIGGALAFKAKKFNTKNVFCITTIDQVAGTNTCGAVATNFAQTNVFPAATTTAPCPQVAGLPASITSHYCTLANITTTLSGTITSVYTLGLED